MSYIFFRLLISFYIISNVPVNAASFISTDDLDNVVHEILISLPMAEQLSSSRKQMAQDLEVFTANLMAEMGQAAVLCARKPSIEYANESVCNDLRIKAESEGCKVVTAKTCYYVRDAKICSPENAVLKTSDCVGMRAIPADSRSHGEVIFDRSINREKYLSSHHAMAASKHPNLSGHCGSSLKSGGSALSRRTAEGLSAHVSGQECFDNFSCLVTSDSNLNIKSSRSCLEGGNVLIASNKLGVIKVFIGDEGMTYTHQLLRRIGFFKDFSQNTIAKTETLLGQHNEQINNLHKTNQIIAKLKEFSQQINDEMSDEEIMHVLGEMNVMGLLTNFDTSNIKKARDLVSMYLAERRFIQLVLWPAEFGVAAGDVIVLPQLAYHLDVFLKKGKKGSMFVLDMEAGSNLVSNILTKYELSETDTALALEYIEEAKLIDAELRSIYIEVYDKISDAGFDIIKTPGGFFTSRTRKKEDQMPINFINALSGLSPVSGQPFYICLGAKVGQQLGDLLMNEFEQFMSKEIHGVNLHFIGTRVVNGKIDYEPAMVFFNVRNAGAHCLSFELKQTRS